MVRQKLKELDPGRRTLHLIFFRQYKGCLAQALAARRLHLCKDSHNCRNALPSSPSSLALEELDGFFTYRIILHHYMCKQLQSTLTLEHRSLPVLMLEIGNKCVNRPKLTLLARTGNQAGCGDNCMENTDWGQPLLRTGEKRFRRARQEAFYTVSIKYICPPSIYQARPAQSGHGVWHSAGVKKGPGVSIQVSALVAGTLVPVLELPMCVTV